MNVLYLCNIKRMVVITIVTQKYGETVYFDEPIPKVISCSLFNSWHNLTKEGGASLFDKQGNASVMKIPPGHYNIEILGKEIKDVFKIYSYQLGTERNTPFDQLVIFNP